MSHILNIIPIVMLTIVLCDHVRGCCYSKWRLNNRNTNYFYSCTINMNIVYIGTSFLFVFQKIIEEVEEILNNLPGVTSVHGRFYDLSSKYYRIVGNHASYYKDALRYLGCVDIRDLPGGKKHDGKQTGLDFVLKHCCALMSKTK